MIQWDETNDEKVEQQSNYKEYLTTGHFVWAGEVISRQEATGKARLCGGELWCFWTDWGETVTLTQTRRVDGLHRLLDLVQNRSVHVQSLRRTNTVRTEWPDATAGRCKTCAHNTQLNTRRFRFFLFLTLAILNWGPAAAVFFFFLSFKLLTF